MTRWLLQTLLLIVVCNTAFLTHSAPLAPEYSQMTVKDSGHRLVWLRCSMGQTFNGYTCIGDPSPLTLEQGRASAQLARQELEGQWRLPTYQELESLVCRSCKGVKIDSTLFPNTAPGAYWSESDNALNAHLYWSVSFLNGFSFGRNPPELQHYVRLVRSFTDGD